MGSGKVKYVNLDEVLDEEFSEYMIIDLKIKGSDALNNANFWHCKEGINENTLPMLN